MMELVLAFVALGSNLGDRGGYLALARERLRRLPHTTVRGESMIEETDPLEGLPQPRYLNQMVALQTELSPRELLSEFQRIEKEAGRVLGERWASRTLDLDLVTYGNLEIDEPGLRLPHPGLRSRDFWQRELDDLSGLTLPTWAQVSPERLEHIQRVAALVSRWSDEMGVPDSERNRWLKAAWLHDALRDAPPADLHSLASVAGPSELLHGPASASRAKAEGETDRGVLDAVRYHSVGLAEWDMVGRVLYCADFLEPGRDIREGRAARVERFAQDPHGVLYEVARDRMVFLINSGWTILQPTLRFWNSLTAVHTAH